MSEYLSSAAQERQPTRVFGEDGTIRDTNSSDTDDYYRQNLGRTELGFEDFDPSHDRDSARMTAAAKLEGALLDLDERGASTDEKAEVEAALETVTTIEPDKERKLSRIGVATKEIERLEGWVKTFRETNDKRLDAAISKLNSARLVVDVLTAAEDEQTDIMRSHAAGKANSESYNVAQVDAYGAMADSHNGLVRRNRSRRDALRKAS
ncbi:MAG: hypothetical protein ACMG55_16880 [Microcoleus sp.]